ncbi:M48 family metallopeptidase [candidate division WOR-3 bacterium]|nr:M48 family metallopeptidase [candidate division WOR-3 bacterium]
MLKTTVPEISNYRVFYRKVKYPRIEFTTGELVLILPYGTKPEEIYEKHSRWIEKKRAFIDECIKEAEGKELVARESKDFGQLIQNYMEEISKDLNVKANKIFFRKMKTKWASLSGRNNITANTLMKFLPENMIEYIIFHELAHLIERRHNKKFWKIIEFRYPNHNHYEKSLFGYWVKIQEGEIL